MTAIEPTSSVPRHSDSNSSLVRLERNKLALISLEEQLKSYVCEPKTQRLFERMENLKHNLKSLKNSNQEMINALKNHTLFSEDVKDRIRKQLDTYKSLELKVLEYIGMAKLHC